MTKNGNYQSNFPEFQAHKSRNGRPYNADPPKENYWNRPIVTPTVPHYNRPGNEDVFSPEQLMEVFVELTTVCLTCRNKVEQIKALGSIVTKYLIHSNGGP
jgi:hypothetical protein